MANIFSLFRAPALPGANAPRSAAPLGPRPGSNLAPKMGEDVYKPSQTRLSGEGREAVAEALIQRERPLSWASAPGEKLRALATLAETRTDRAAAEILEEYRAHFGELPEARQIAFLRSLFQALLRPGAAGQGDPSPAARDQLVAELRRDYEAGRGSADVRLQYAYALALSRTPAGAEALIAAYKKAPAGSKELERTLRAMAFCPTEPMARFLAREYQSNGDEATRMQVLEALQAVLSAPSN